MANPDAHGHPRPQPEFAAHVSATKEASRILTDLDTIELEIANGELGGEARLLSHAIHRGVDLMLIVLEMAHSVWWHGSGWRHYQGSITSLTSDLHRCALHHCLKQLRKRQCVTCGALGAAVHNHERGKREGSTADI